jgi:hypothetical protein
MSLTSFLASSSALRQRLLKEFPKPAFRVKTELKAPPLTNSYGLTGTAFDYLLRFYLQKLNPNAQTRTWIAKQGLARLDVKYAGAGKDMFKEAERRHTQFLASNNIRPGREIAEAAVMLAHLDTVFRVRILDEAAFKPVPHEILDDLETMLAIIPADSFTARSRCVLNPRFGSASNLVGGADGDLIIDGTLIDLKSSKKPDLDRETFNQVLLYYVLSCIGGIENCREGAVEYLGVYFARYGVLHRIPVKEVVRQAQMSAFLEWFKECAKNGK